MGSSGPLFKLCLHQLKHNIMYMFIQFWKVTGLKRVKKLLLSACQQV